MDITNKFSIATQNYRPQENQSIQVDALKQQLNEVQEQSAKDKIMLNTLKDAYYSQKKLDLQTLNFGKILTGLIALLGAGVTIFHPNMKNERAFGTLFTIICGASSIGMHIGSKKIKKELDQKLDEAA